MNVRRKLVHLSMAAPLPTVTACATTRRSADGEARTAVRVVHNATPLTSPTVYIVPAAGVRQMLGVVSPSDTTVLRFRQPAVSGSYHLVGETTAGNPIASRPFGLPGVRMVEWAVSPDMVQVMSEAP